VSGYNRGVPIPDFARRFPNIALPRLGARAVFVTDDFFAAVERLIRPADAVFIPDKFDDHGKWMDGWESRRKRGPGHDHCVLKLGFPARIKGVDIDTSHFNGNQPLQASVDGAHVDGGRPGDGDWENLIAPVDTGPDAHHYHEVNHQRAVTHLRLNIFPDGGVARLRVFGRPEIDWGKVAADTLVDLAAVENGGRAVCCNDQHFGTMHNLTAPGRGVNMGDGWETRRRRGPGHDWVVLALGHPGIIRRILIDTAHFKGNYPDRAAIQAAKFDGDENNIAEVSEQWPLLLPQSKLGADAEHVFEKEIHDAGVVSHVRLSIHPDGGVSRLRLFGVVR